MALPLHEGSYKWSGGKSVSVFDSTLVEVETDAGVTGWGEVCPLGPFYLPAYGPGARTGIAELGPHLIGLDPRELGRLNHRMDAALKGHPYVKSAIDMACWDILGKAAGLPVCTLLGGRFGEAVDLYRAISQEPAARMAARVAQYRAEGYRKFQLKVGGDPGEDIARIRAVRAKLKAGDVLVADANTGWLMHDAARVVRAVRDLDVYIEQPCLSFEECLAVRRRTDHPFVLDETIDSIDVLLRAHAEGAMDVINLKISKVGGLTKARQIRDLCVSLGIAMTIEDSWGGDITTAAIAHLAHSTPEALRFSATDFNSYVTVSTAEGAPRRQQGAWPRPPSPGSGSSPGCACWASPCSRSRLRASDASADRLRAGCLRSEWRRVASLHLAVVRAGGRRDLGGRHRQTALDVGGAQHREGRVEDHDHHQHPQVPDVERLHDVEGDEHGRHSAQGEADGRAQAVALVLDELQAPDGHEERAGAHHDRKGGLGIHAEQADQDQARTVEADPDLHERAQDEVHRRGRWRGAFRPGPGCRRRGPRCRRSA